MLLWILVFTIQVDCWSGKMRKPGVIWELEMHHVPNFSMSYRKVRDLITGQTKSWNHPRNVLVL